MTIPTFIMVGAEKAASTWMWHALNGHPDCSVCQPKEVNYFNDNYERGKDWYLGHFDFSKSIVGDVSPLYLYHEKVPERILSELGAVKIIICLRNPYDRTMSHLFHESVNSYGTVSKVSVQDLTSLAESDQKFVDRSCYSNGVRRYMSVFGAENTKVLYYEDLQTDASGFLSTLYSFVGLSESFVPPNTVGIKRNTTVDYRSKWLFDLLRKMTSIMRNAPVTSKLLEMINRRTGLRARVLDLLQVDRGRVQASFQDVFTEEEKQEISADIVELEKIGLILPDTWGLSKQL